MASGSVLRGVSQLSEGKIAGALVFIFFVATTAGTWAAWNAAPSIPGLIGAVNAAGHDASNDPADERPLQASNADAKSDRLAAVSPLAFPQPSAAAEPSPTTFSLAAVSSTAVEPPQPRIEMRKSVAVAPPEKEKPKRADPKLLLDDAQIASLRTRLKLTPTQEEFWPAVEVTLRDMVRAHARKTRNGRVAQIDVNSPEVQQLINAAVPLIMRLSEEQKREVRALARIIGLETVASKI